MFPAGSLPAGTLQGSRAYTIDNADNSATQCATVFTSTVPAQFTIPLPAKLPQITVTNLNDPTYLRTSITLPSQPRYNAYFAKTTQGGRSWTTIMSAAFVGAAGTVDLTTPLVPGAASYAPVNGQPAFIQVTGMSWSGAGLFSAVPADGVVESCAIRYFNLP
jgi:hypothetical protein